MENLRILGILLTFLLAGSVAPVPVFSYERDTHKGISQATIEAYERLLGETFDSEQTTQVVQGSFNEDDGTRPLNHFFDPINNRGLTVLFNSWPMSRLWAQDTVAQANYCDWGFCSKRVGYNDKHFSSPTDYSWDRAIYEYVHGDKARGLRALGHVLHLLQDSSVPAHVRNDQHLNHDGVGDPDPYEKFTGKFGQGSVTTGVDVISFPVYGSLDEYISAMASYTNRGFLSKDTLFKDFVSPSLDSLDLRKDNFAYDKDGHRVSFVKKTYDPLRGGSKEIISIDNAGNDPQSLVLNDYWIFLSREAIRNGVGIIDLFFKEVEREKITGNVKAKNTSEAERRAKTAVLKGFGLVKKLYGSSLTEADVAALSSGSSAAAALNALDSAIPSQVLPLEAEALATQDPEEELVDEEASFVDERQAIQATLAPTTTLPIKDSEEQELFPVPAGGGGGMPPAQVIGETGDIPIPVIVSPIENSYHNGVSIQVSGTGEPNHVVEISYTQVGITTVATSSVAVDGTWSVSIAPAEGSVVLGATIIAPDGRASQAVNRSFFIDRTGADVSSFEVVECGYSLRTSDCAVLNTARVRLASSSPDTSYIAVLVDGALVATSTAQEVSISLITGLHSISGVAYDTAGNAATSTAISVESLDMPVVVNEVAWSGTAASAQAQWIELYNRTAQPIALSNVFLTIGSGPSFQLSGTIGAGSFYLVERAETDTSVTADEVLSLGELTSAQQSISLMYSPNGFSTTTIDATPSAETCGGVWCYGTDAPGFRSMERKHANTLGSLAANWTSNDGFWRNGTDQNGAALNASPKRQNSQSLSSIGYFCEPATVSFVEGGYYQFGNGEAGRCTYESPNFGGNRYGIVFIGTVGSSTSLSSHYLGQAVSKFEFEPQLPDPQQGMDLFAAVMVPNWQYFNDDLNAFISFFEHGTPPPSLDYGIIRFKWGVAP